MRTPKTLVTSLLSLSAAALLALSAAGAASAAPAPGNTPAEISGVSSHTVVETGGAEYWTEERMRSAIPGDVLAEIASGKLIAFDQHHINESRAGKNIFIRREDALNYLKAYRFRTVEDPGSLPVHSAPKPKASATKATTLAKAFAADHQRESTKEDSVYAPKRTAALVDPAAPVTTQISTPTPPPGTKSLSSQQHGKAHQTSKKSIETLVESERQIAATVILRRRQVEARTSLSRSAIYDRLDPHSPRYDPTFPKQVKLGYSSVGWLESEIENWLAARTRASRQ